MRGVRWLNRWSHAARYASPTTEAVRVSRFPRTGLVASLGYALVAASLFGFTASESAGESAAHASSVKIEAQSPLATGVNTADLDRSRDALLTEATSSIEDFRTKSALAAREKALLSAATVVRAEVDRLRNLSTFAWPTAGGVASGFGWRRHPILGYLKLHSGADIGGRCGQPIYAAQSGVVTKAAASGYNGGSGINARINHGQIDGVTVETAYLHMSQLKLRGGQRINKGDLIGLVGSTGLSTACHLHLSLYKNGASSDPLQYVKK